MALRHTLPVHPSAPRPVAVRLALKYQAKHAAMGRRAGRDSGRVWHDACRTDPRVLRMIVHGKVALLKVVPVTDSVNAGTDAIYRDCHATLVTSSPTNSLVELTWCTCCAFKRGWELRTLENMQKGVVREDVASFGSELIV